MPKGTGYVNTFVQRAGGAAEDGTSMSHDRLPQNGAVPDPEDDEAMEHEELEHEATLRRWAQRTVIDQLFSTASQRTGTHDHLQRDPAGGTQEQSGDEGEPEEEILSLPLLPVRDTVVFPHMVTSLIVGRERSLRAVDEAMQGDHTLVVVAQREPEKEEVEPDDLYGIGTEVIIGKTLRLPDGSTSILVRGRRRLRLLDIPQLDPYILALAEPAEHTLEKDLAVEALMRHILSLFEQYVRQHPSVEHEALVTAMNIEDPAALADFIASSVVTSLARRQRLLEILDPLERLKAVNVLLAHELELLAIQTRIEQEVRAQIEKDQHEFFLREQMKAITAELGETDTAMADVAELRAKVAEANLPPLVAERANKELDRLAAMPPPSPEVTVIRTYLDWLLNLPWTQRTEDRLDIKEAARVLEESHYGLARVKERILEYMSVRKLSQSARSPILCFVGPPGVGKTSLGRSIAQALGRKFVRVSLGGIRDEAEIRGHRRTYVGALPGRIIQTMRVAGTINPIFMMDEIDKVGTDFRGDPSAALLEVLDPEQNHAFSDHYLEIPYDLSQVIFILTANVLDTVPPALRDRMEVIELPGYVEDEKLHIARQFLVPRQLQEHGLKADQLRFTDGALRRLIREYTREAGVRNLEREIATICRKVARRVAEEQKTPGTITAGSLAKYLGPPQYFHSAAEERDEVGIATGVYWTPAGGDLMAVEVTLMEGEGQLILTGQLGDVMQESAQAALSYVRSRARDFGINRDFEKTDVHVHVPSGALPKDGPAAGITMAAALVSALTGRPARRDVAMTGEITLRGRVLPVGGIKEKVLAAHRAGIKTFVLPKKNAKDLSEVPADVQRDIHFVFVEHMDEVLKVALRELHAGAKA